MDGFNGFERRADFLVWQCPEVLFDARHRRQSRVDYLTCNVELDVAVSLGVGEHSQYALPELTGNRRFRCPYRQSCQHIGLRDAVDSHIANHRIAVCLQLSMPLDRGFRVLTTRRVRLCVPIRSLPETSAGQPFHFRLLNFACRHLVMGEVSAEQTVAKSGLMATRVLQEDTWFGHPRKTKIRLLITAAKRIATIVAIRNQFSFNQ